MSKDAIRHNEGKIVCLSPVVCLTPSKNGPPVPYMNMFEFAWANKAIDITSFGGEKAFTMDSRTNKCAGDEPGKGGGVISQVMKGWCRPQSNKTSFTIKGKQVQQHDRVYEMNCNGADGSSNTVGKIIMAFLNVASPELVMDIFNIIIIRGKNEPWMGSISTLCVNGCARVYLPAHTLLIL